MEGGLEVDWRSFSLEQVNNRAGEGVQVWTRPQGYESTGLDAFAVAEAARRQENPEAWDRLHLALLAARHTGRKEKLTAALTRRLAEETGFDSSRLERDLADPAILQPLAEQHTEGMALGVFGTPTIYFENGQGAYLKMLPAPTGDEAVRAWEHFKSVVAEQPYIAEIKRPAKPRSA